MSPPSDRGRSPEGETVSEKESGRLTLFEAAARRNSFLADSRYGNTETWSSDPALPGEAGDAASSASLD